MPPASLRLSLQLCLPFAACTDSPSKPAGALDAFDDDFDAISATRLFRIIPQVIENHNTSASMAFASVQIRSIDLATTFVAQLPVDLCDEFLAALADHITRAGGSCTRVENTATTKYNIVCFGIDRCNLATCSTSCPVHSGGHHGFQGIPVTLQAGADFHQRATYAADTHGWVATDEMAFFGTLFQSLCGDSVKFSPPMYWDTQMDDFDESPFGEFLADPDVKTIVPVLFRAHWGALEIERIHNRAHVTICQFPTSLHDAVLRIVARRIDIGFSRLVPHVEFDSPAPHLCGWTLVGKWIKELQILERLPDFRQQVPEPDPNLRSTIDFVVDTTLNNLRDARAQAQLAIIAVKLRRDFFYFLLKTIGHGDQVTPHELLSAFPCHYTQPLDEPSPIPLSSLSTSHVIDEKIEARLSHFLLHRGWMATDEFNYLCDYAKRVNPSTLVTPAAVWCPARKDLLYPEKPPPNLRPYGHIIWPVLFEHHCIQFEIYKASERSMLNLLVTAPHSMQPRLNQIIINILAQLHTSPDQANITYVVQLSPPNMCGYAVVKDIFDRLEIGIPPVAEQIQQCLIQSKYQGTIHRIQQDDRQVWISSGASDDLRLFAWRCRTIFLAQVVCNNFPREFFAAGIDGDMCTLVNVPPSLCDEGTTAPLLACRNFGDLSVHSIINFHYNPLAFSTIQDLHCALGRTVYPAVLQQFALSPGAPVRSGGHHGYRGFPCTLQAGANFAQRAEYSINTHGWLASDELFYISQMFDWASDHAVHFTPPVYWDVSSSDFDESPYGEIDVNFDRPTIIPILLQAHWGAIEVLRKESSIDLTLHQIPVHLHQSLVRIVGRRMDVGPSRISLRVGSLQYTPHLCGWQLIYKWASDLNLFDHIPDITGQFNVPSPEIQDLIRMVVSAAMEDWRDAQATPAVALLAAKLRRYFFYAVWTATESGHPASEHTLLSAYPLHYIQPPDAPRPLTLSSATMRHVIADRIESRFDHMSLHAGWLATDEFDHICEIVRIMDPHTLIAPASVWCPVRQTLVFPAKPTPEYRPYEHILWPIIFRNHWLQIEVYKVHHTQSVHLLLTAPPAMHQSLNHIVNHILEALNVIPATAPITYFVETTPPGMCGYVLVKNIFDRATINIPEFSTQQLLRLTLSEHAHRIAVLQREARRVWDRSGASNDLIRFADFVRSSFLLKVISNDFPPDYFAGGMEDANMSPRQSAPAAPPSTKADPVWVNDPWKAYKPKQQQSRWEDLILAEDHPFKGPDGKPIEQIHRLQASPWRGGIVLSTKSHLPDLLHLDPTNAVLAVVLPAAEPSSFGAVASRLEGPHEVVLKDETSKTSYKRLVLLIVIKGKIAYQLPKPTLKFTTVQVSELVLEIDNRFVSRI